MLAKVQEEEALAQRKVDRDVKGKAKELIEKKWEEMKKTHQQMLKK